VYGLINAQTKKQLKEHRARVESSKQQKTVLVSLDSFYCNGIVLAVMRKGNQMDETYCFRGLRNEDTLLMTRLMPGIDGGKDGGYYNYYFPALGVSCDVVRTNKEMEVLETICRQRLFNSNGLDTFNAEAFVMVKGSTKKKEENKQLAAVKFRKVNRDRNAVIILVGNDIYQDSMIIGSYLESVLDSPNGTSMRQVQVYNTQKQPVSFSTEIQPGSQEWRTITNQDGKYAAIRSGAGKDRNLYDIITFLVKNDYL
jgi:hypothetical protein